jgi:hypothetical protein
MLGTAVLAMAGSIMRREECAAPEFFSARESNIDK